MQPYARGQVGISKLPDVAFGRVVQAVACLVFVLAQAMCSDLPAQSIGDDALLSEVSVDVGPDGATDTDGTDSAKGAFCNGAWMCDKGNCIHESKSAPAIGANIGLSELIRGTGWASAAEFMAVLYHKEDCCWGLATTEAAVLKLEPDGKLSYASDRIPSADEFQSGRSTAGTQVFVISQFPSQPMATVFGEGMLENLEHKLYSRQSDGNFKVIQATGGGNASYLGPAPGSSDSQDHVLMLYYENGSRLYYENGSEKLRAQRARLIDLKSKSMIWDRNFPENISLARAGDEKRIIPPTPSYSSGGIDFLSGKLWLYTWALQPGGLAEFSVREVGQDLTLGPKVHTLIGPAIKYGYTHVRVIAEALYISGMFQSSKSLVKIDPAAGPIPMPPAYSNLGPDGWFDLVPLANGDWLYSDDGLELKRVGPGGNVVWSAKHSDEDSLASTPVRIGDRQYWTTRTFRGGVFIQTALGRFAMLYKLGQNPIPQRSPMDLEQPWFVVPQISPYYLHYFDVETGKPLCY